MRQTFAARAASPPRAAGQYSESVNVGQNQSRIIEAVKDELDRKGPAMLQSHVPELAGELAGRTGFLYSRRSGVGPWLAK
jgi:hypothetical protein